MKIFTFSLRRLFTKANHLFLFATLFFFVFLGNAQNVPQHVDVNKLSNSQVQQAQQALNNSGLSREAAIEVARQKGASEQQIREMLQRMDEMKSAQSSTGVITSGNDALTSVSDTVTGEADKIVVIKKTIDGLLPETRFGEYLFNSVNLTFEPSPNISTPKNYLINIEDQLIITIWGNSQASYQLVVNRNGQVQIPDIGPVYVAGLTFENAEEKLINKLSLIYAGIKGANANTFAQIDLGKMRSIRVNIVGDAQTPGTYTLPATASVFNALFLSGGPNKIGSFRNIQLIRNNKTFKTIDIYKYLMEGDQSENSILQDDDIIFIPTCDKLVTVNGEFKRKAIFELKNAETLTHLINFAGGYTDETYLYRMKMIRKTQSGFKMLDFKQSELETIHLENGDQLIAEKIIDRFQNKVTIEGAVWRPGDYELTEGMSLYDLIMKADSITPDAYSKGGHILTENPDLSQRLVPFTLSEVLSRQKNILLKKDDKVFIKSHFEMKETEILTVSGEVNAPYITPFIESLTLRDAIYLANGLKEGADSSYIEVSRRLGYEKEAGLSDTLRTVFTFSLPRDLNTNDVSGRFLLHPYDRVVVRRAPGYRDPEEVTILGEVKFAGSYTLETKNMRIADLIRKAGGLTVDAYPKGAHFQRFGTALGNEKIGIELDQILIRENHPTNLLLMNKDVIMIPKRLETVKVSGSVQNPMSIIFGSNQNLRYYIDQAGGFTEGAKKNKVYVKYANGSVATTKIFIVRSYPEIRPGAEIVVPLKIDKPRTDNTGKWLGIASTLSTIAMAVSYFLK